MRRKDRALSREAAEAIVDACVFAVLSTVNSDGTPYGAPLSIAREGEWIYFHGAKEGQKVDNLKAMNRVCLTCVGETKVPEGKFLVEYASAVVFGTAQELVEASEKIHGLRLISLRHTPNNMGAFDEAVVRQLGATGVWKIHIDQITGKQSKPRRE
ncbi:MAG: pyridoxamine 5'-phosphate oxidase family protein [Treponema sp.]|jgi:nitroimidazol reductase NimA-like FMN-containing flavoprotein (pyridoxamine 5'-phosphate oxidase superfamily)|nr:pyridoxamine 5'-phosphate oxidase family protein [Treponema sp.]